MDGSAPTDPTQYGDARFTAPRPSHPLRTWRRKNNVSLQKLADQCNCTRWALQRMEAGKFTPLEICEAVQIATGGDVRIVDIIEADQKLRRVKPAGRVTRME